MEYHSPSRTAEPACMFHLILNVIFASTFILCIKWVQNREREDILSVGAINYIVAAIWISPEFFQSRGGDLSMTALSTSAVVTGATMGACYFLAYFLVIHTVRLIGAASSTVVGVTSILLPILCGIFIWSEQPNGLQLVGVFLALASLALIGWRSDNAAQSERPWFTPAVMLIFFVLAGVARLAQEAFKHTSDADDRPTFLFVAFLVTAIPSIAILLVRRRSISVRELAFGFTMGAANILQTHFILKSLEQFDGFIVFPVTSAGGLILTTLIATRMLGEQLTRRTYTGIGIAVCALVLLNWTPT
ncbi:MAG: DMT family transporter [Pirellulaceae bacterium]|jgi:drug/metabolite transporter (DMT)-like permease|nr:DMT family transporter [Pirellulaceae bacterium]